MKFRIKISVRFADARCKHIYKYACTLHQLTNDLFPDIWLFQKKGLDLNLYCLARKRQTREAKRRFCSLRLRVFEY